MFLPYEEVAEIPPRIKTKLVQHVEVTEIKMVLLNWTAVVSLKTGIAGGLSVDSQVGSFRLQKFSILREAK